jgi:uridine kinase
MMRAESNARPFQVGIAGPRNSSKSGTAKEMLRVLSQHNRAALLSMDNYFKPWEFFRATGIDPARQGKDPAGIDLQRLQKDVDALRQGRVIEVQTRDRYQRGYRGEVQTIPGQGLDVLLIEGMSAIAMLSRELDLSVYIDISEVDAEKNLFFKPARQRSLGLPVLSDREVYERFGAVDLKRFDEYYPLSRAQAGIVVRLLYWADRYVLSSLILRESVLRRLIKGERT